MEKVTLIVSHSEDVHVDHAIKLFADKGHKIFRLNLDQFPRDYDISYQITGERIDGLLSNIKTGGTVSLSAIVSVWTRKPAEFAFVSPDLTAQELVFARQESEHALKGFLHCLKCYWINHPLAVQRALWKPEQQLRAASVGFKTIQSLITNNPGDICRFFESATDGMVVKTLSSPFLGADKVSDDEIIHSGGLPTTLITQQHMEDIESVREFPCYFQRFVDKAFDLRVTVIGNYVFAAKIDSQSDERTRIDFRNYDADVRYSAFEMAPEFAQQCRSFVHSYGLEYGAMDFVADQRGEFYFLENNPAGEFIFIEHRAPELKMMDSITSTLIRGQR